MQAVLVMMASSAFIVKGLASAQQSLRVAMRQLRHVSGAQIQFSQKIPAACIRAERIIDRVHHALEPNHRRAAVEWRPREVSAGGHMHLLYKGFGRAALQAFGRRSVVTISIGRSQKTLRHKMFFRRNRFPGAIGSSKFGSRWRVDVLSRQQPTTTASNSQRPCSPI
jgi:hypothetical protein